MNMFQPIQNPFFEQMKGILKNTFKDKIIAAGLEWSEELDERLYEPLFKQFTNDGVLEFKRIEVLATDESEQDVKKLDVLINNFIVHITIRTEPQIAYINDYYDFLEDNNLSEEEYSMESFIRENEIDASEIVYGIRVNYSMEDTGQLFLNAIKQRSSAEQAIRDADIVIAGLSEVAAELEALGYDLSAGPNYYESVGTDHQDEDDYEDVEEDDDDFIEEDDDEIIDDEDEDEDEDEIIDDEDEE